MKTKKSKDKNQQVREAIDNFLVSVAGMKLGEIQEIKGHDKASIKFEFINPEFIELESEDFKAYQKELRESFEPFSEYKVE